MRGAPCGPREPGRLATLAIVFGATLFPAQSVASDAEPTGAGAEIQTAVSGTIEPRIVVTRSPGHRGTPLADGDDCTWPGEPEDARSLCHDPVMEGSRFELHLTNMFFGMPTPVTEKSTYDYSTFDISATADADYMPQSGTLTIEAGQSRSQTVHIVTLDDDIDEHDERFGVHLTRNSGARLTFNYAIYTIRDNDAAPTLSIADASAAEAEGSLELRVTLSEQSERRVSANYATSDGSATAPGDYTATSGTLSIEAGQTEGTISVPIVHDGVLEPDETLTLTLSNPQNATLLDGFATATITDSGHLPTVSVTDVSGVEDDVGSLLFEVSLDAAGGVATTVDYATTDGTATAASDYAATSGSLTFSAGELKKTIAVPVLADSVPEEDETITLTLSNAVNGRLQRGVATGTIFDDDATLSVAGGAALEARGPVEFVVTLQGGGSQRGTVTVNYATSDGTATAGNDYMSTSGMLTYSDVGTQTVRVTVHDDSDKEPDETFTLTLSGPSNAEIPEPTATGTIRNDDGLRVELTAEPSRVSEGDGPTDVTVTAALVDGLRTVATTVTVSVDWSGNFNAVDFINVPDFDITIAAGVATGAGTFEIRPANDSVSEDDEQVQITGTSDLPVSGTTITLEDDDVAATGIALSASPSRVSEGAGATAVTVTAALDGGVRTAETSVTVSVSGSGAADAVDFAAVPNFEIEIAAGATTGTGTFTLTPEDDSLDESDETLAIGGSSDLPVTGTEVTLEDDDVASTGIALSASPSRVSEGAGATAVTVTAALDGGARTVDTEVTVSVAGSGAADAVDFAAVADFEIDIPAGATSGTGTFTLAPEDDSLDESDETLTIGGSSDLPVTGTEVTLADDDATSMGILLSASPSRVSEGAGATAVTVTAALDGGARTVVTEVTVSVSGSGAADAVDFSAVADFEIDIPAGATSGSGTFSLTPEDDSQDESDETLTIDGGSDLPVTGTEVTLADDDATSMGIVLSASPSRVSEGAGAAAVTVTAALDGGARTVGTEVTVSVAGSGAADAVDFAAVADFEIDIPAGATSGSGTFSLTPDDDSLDESDETLTIGGSSDLPVTGTEVTLADDDATSMGIVLSASPSRVSEGAGAAAVTVTAALDGGARTVGTAVTVSVAGSGVADAVDFAAVADFEIDIPAGATRAAGTFTLDPENDRIDESDETLAIGGSSDLPVTGTEVTLADDDATSMGIVLSASPSRVSEGAGAAAVTVTAALDGGARTVGTEVTVSVAGSGAADAVDFAAVADFEIDIPAGATSGSGTFNLTPDDDSLDESDETLTIGGSSDLPVTGTEVTLADDDATSTGILLSASPSRVSEGAGAAAVTVTAALDGGARTVGTAVTVSVAGSGVADAVDFAAVADFEIDIPAGATSGTGTFTLTPEDDSLDESDETLAIDGGSDLPVTGTTVTLADDDATSMGIVLSAVPANVSEGAGATEITVTATLDGGARSVETPVTVMVSGSGAADAVDFVAVPNFGIAIEAGATSGSGTFTLEPEDDHVLESNETLTLSGMAMLDVTATTIVIADDDAASTGILLSASPSRVAEDGGPAQLTVTASLNRAARTVPTTVMVTVSGSGDPDAVDFAPVSDFEIDIPAGATSGAGAFTLDPEDDAVDEVDETLAVGGNSDLPVTGATISLVDDDATSMGIVLSAVPANVSEGAGATEITVTATLDGGARSVETPVTVMVSGSGAADAVDFVAVPNFGIAIEAEATSGSGTFTLEPEDDHVLESNETLTLSGMSMLDVTATTIVIADDDAASTGILLSASPSRVAEDGGPAQVTVTASLNRAGRTVPTTVMVTVSGSGDPDAVDFAPVSDFEIDIPAGATSGAGAFTLDPEDDAVDEVDETLAVGGNSDLPVTGTTVTLADDDATSMGIVLSAVPANVSEGTGETEIGVTATLDGGARSVETTVTVTVSGSGAADAVDFGAVSDLEIEIPAGAASATGKFTLTPEDDSVDESDETLTIDGSSDLPVTGTSVTLADDDATSTGILLSASPSRVSEGAGPTTVTVTATLEGGARTVATAVSVTALGSGDPDAVDFAPVPDFEIEIPADATSGAGTFTLNPEDDAVDEADETLTVDGNADLPVTGTIVMLADDDATSTRIVLSASPPRVSEGAGATTVTVTASLEGSARAIATAVSVTVSGSGDPDAADFAPVAGFEIAIPANALSGAGTFRLDPEDDDRVEADERLTISGASVLPVESASITLADDDEVSTRVLLFLTVDPPRAAEGDGEIRVTVTAAVDKGVRPDDTRITVSVSGSGDPDAVDFTPVPDFQVVIPAGVRNGTATFTVVPEDDLTVEADETLTVSGDADLPVTPATMELVDDDEASGRIVLSADPARVSEGDGPVAVTVTASLDRGLLQEGMIVTLSVSGSGDPDAVDFDPVPDFVITIEANATSGTGTFVLMPEDDAEDEADETLTLRGVSDLPVTSASVVLADDDEMEVIRVLSIADAEAGESAGEIGFNVRLDGPSAARVTVSYATADAGSADPVAGADIDYQRKSGRLTFAPGEIAQTIRVTVLDDSLDEPDETFALLLSDLQGAALGRGSALGTIRDDDEPPVVSVADSAGDEDVGALEFEVTLSAPSGIEVSASYATADGTATAGSDYEAASDTLSFAPGEVSKTIRVPIINDNTHEADEETFELTLSALVNATSEDVSATGTIRDDDLAPPSLVGQFPAALLCVGGAPYELDLSDYFGGEELGFSAVSSTPDVATAALAGSLLIVAPVSEGASSVAVTATNDAGSVESAVSVRVVTDLAEIEAVESVLASIGRAVLTGVTESVRARFDSRSIFGERGASGAQGVAASVRRDPAQVVPEADVGNPWPMDGARSVGWDQRGLFEPHVSADDWFETMSRTHRRGLAPFSFSLDSSQSGPGGPAWSVWGRADKQRFESGMDRSSHDGALTAVHLGADARAGDWLAGVSVALVTAEADYRFERSTDACGGGGTGEGMVDAELTSVHPYVGRQIGRGQVWATLGAGGGEVSLERCETGHRNEANLSMRLAALGGRHPFAGGERMAVSVVEEIGVLDLTTGDAIGPVGNRSVTVGQARIGLEASGIAPAGCDCSLTTFVRAFARGDWGDGATGAGLELAAGVRFRNLPRRLGIDAGIRALAVHSAEDAAEHSANLTFSLLPKADGTGWQASMTWRQGASDAGLDTLGGITRWPAPSGSLPGAKRHWLAESRLGYGLALRRGLATPFVELDAGRSDRRGVRFGMRHQYGDSMLGLVMEWGIEPNGFGSDGSKILLEALGRF